MKGMQKIKRGKEFSGVVLYVLKPGKHHKLDPCVIGGNLVGDKSKQLIEEFNISISLLSGVMKPVWYISLHLPKGESLANEQWVAFADDYMKKMRSSETHLHCYILHGDEAGQHIQIVASRIALEGDKLYLGKNENLISTRIISELEIVHSYTISNFHRTEGSKAEAFTQ